MNLSHIDNLYLIKSPVKSITIVRAEGPHYLCNKKYVFNSFVEANSHIASKDYTYPKMGYDKHDVTVEWENGFKYTLRLDCQHPANRFYSGNRIDDRIRRAQKYYTSEKTPDKETKDFYVTLEKECDLGIEY